MRMQDEMRRFLDEVPGVDLVAFGDLSSGLILNSAAHAACPREVLDLLGEKAVACFALLAPGALPPEAAFGSIVIHFSESGSRLFARDPVATDDVICVVSQPGARLEPLVHAATTLARRIAGAP